MKVPPGPKGLSIIGNLEDYEEDRLGFLSRCAKEYGDVAAYSDKIYVISRPDLVERVLTNTNREFLVSLNLFRQDVGDDVTSAMPTTRHLIGQGLHKSAILSYAAQLVHLTEDVLRTWHVGDTIDIQQEMESLTARVTAEYCFGPDGKQIPALTKALLDTLVPIASSPFVFPSWFPSPSLIRAHRASRRLNQEIQAILDNRRRQQSYGCDMLATLLHAADADGQVSTNEIVNAIFPVLIASLRVPAAALSWAWYLLARNPNAEKRMHEEIDSVLRDQSPRAADIERLRYVASVAKEALRLYPPTWLLDRKVIVDCELGGYPLVKGQRLVFSPFIMHRDPRYFDSPEEFVPERWLDEARVERLPKYAYLPFGGGPRGCIGSGMAMTEIVLVLATIARQFRFQLIDGKSVTMNSRNTLIPNNLIMRLMAREAGQQRAAP